METKLDKLLGFIRAGQWEKALALAARFPDLGRHRDAIIDGHEAIAHPDFYRQLRKDPDEMVCKGCEALLERYIDGKR